MYYILNPIYRFLSAIVIYGFLCVFMPMLIFIFLTFHFLYYLNISKTADRFNKINKETISDRLCTYLIYPNNTFTYTPAQYNTKTFYFYKNIFHYLINKKTDYIYLGNKRDITGYFKGIYVHPSRVDEINKMYK